MVSIQLSYFPLLFCGILPPSLQLTLAVLTGSYSKLNQTKFLDQITAGSARSHNHVVLETRCHMQVYPNGKIYNCSSNPTSSTPSFNSPEVIKATTTTVARIARKQCESNAHPVGDKCLCNPGFRKFPFSELCVKEEGAGCHFQKNECSTDMTYMACINNVCVCEDTDLFDPVTTRCVGKVGGLCYPGLKDCSSNAECVNIGGRDIMRSDLEEELLSSSTEYVIPSTNDIELSGRCECKEGFVESRDGLCKKGYDTMCNSSDECDSFELVCKEGVCTCRNSLQVYDLTRRSCVSLVGAQCSVNEAGGANCVKHAYCKKSNLKMDWGRCACVENAIETRMRTCSLPTSTVASLGHVPAVSDFMEDNKNEASSRVLFADY